MATNYLKPQEPLKKIDKDTGDINYLYPLVTSDQVILEDGTRLNTALNELDKAEIVAEVLEIVSNSSGGGASGAVVPFSNVKMTKIVHQTISKDADGNYPAQVCITEDDNGNPLELTAFIVKSDIKSAGYSYTQFGIAQTVGVRHAGRGSYSLYKYHGNDQLCIPVFISKYGHVLYFSNNFAGYQAESVHYIVPEYKVREIYFPVGGGFGSGTYVDVWKLEIDE